MHGCFKSICLVALLTAFAPSARAADDKMTDGDAKVPAGKEFSLTPVEVTPSKEADEMGRFEATIKPAKEAKKVKMPQERWTLGFYPTKNKGGGVGIDGPFEGLGLNTMRTEAGKGNEPGAWMVEEGDIITHVNGYKVDTVEEVIVATSLAKDKSDVQVIIKDKSTGKETIFYVTATKP